MAGVQLIVGDKCLGMLEAVGEVFPEVKYQRCTVHFYRHVIFVTPRSKVKPVANAQGAPCSGEQENCSGESQGRDGGTAFHEAEGGRLEGRGWH